MFQLSFLLIFVYFDYMFSLELGRSKPEKPGAYVLTDACNLDLKSSSDISKLRACMMNWNDLSHRFKKKKKKVHVFSFEFTPSIRFHYRIYFSFPCVVSLVVIASTVHYLLVKQVGKWIALGRCFKGAGLIP